MHRLKLDHDNVYWGAERLADGAVPGETDIVLDHAPDNAPGRYRYDREKAVFVALAPGQVKAQPTSVTSERALYEVCRTLAIGGTVLSDATLSWAAAYEDTVDVRANPDIGYFRNQSRGEPK